MRPLKTSTLITVVLVCLANLPAAAQPPDTLWTRTYGFGYGSGVQQTSDGGYIFVGGAYGQVYLVKTDGTGNEVWHRWIGGIYAEYGRSVQQTSDDGYIIAGYTDSGPGGYQVYLVKTNAGGDTTWTRNFGGIGADYGFSVQQTFDGGYIVAGYTDLLNVGNYDVYLVKTDALGFLVWQNAFGGSSGDFGYSVQQTSDSGYVIAGYTNSYEPGSPAVYLIKTDMAGNMEWQRTFGGPHQDEGYSVKQTLDGGYIIAGFSGSFSPYYKVYLIKTDESGNLTWQHVYGMGNDNLGHCVQQTTDGGYIIAGCARVNDDYHVYLIKTDALGNLIWQCALGETNWDCRHSVQQTSDGGYVIAGDTYAFGPRSIYLIKTNTGGNVPLNVTLSPVNPPIIIPAQGGNFNFNASAVNYGTQTPFWVWARIKNPDGTYTAPTLGPVQINPPMGVQVSRQRTQTVPGTWPAGVYTYLGYAHTSFSYPATDSSSFTFTKSAVVDGGPFIKEASCTGEPFPGEENFILHPSSFIILGVSPNPFNATTTISYEMRAASHVSLKVYETTGRLITTLSDGYRLVGSHQVTWNATDQPSGIYFCRLQAGEYTAAQKMVLLK